MVDRDSAIHHHVVSSGDQERRYWSSMAIEAPHSLVLDMQYCCCFPVDIESCLGMQLQIADTFPTNKLFS